jgi:hypothetical protein
MGVVISPFEKREYDEAIKADWQRQRDRFLVEPAAELQEKVLKAIQA